MTLLNDKVKLVLLNQYMLDHPFLCCEFVDPYFFELECQAGIMFVLQRMKTTFGQSWWWHHVHVPVAVFFMSLFCFSAAGHELNWAM